MLSRFEQFAGSISTIYRYIQKIERDEMEKHGLRGAYAQYLLAIARHPQGITAAELGEACDKDKAAVSRVVSELLSKGLIDRKGVGDNLYRARLTLTPAGEQAARVVSKRAQTAVEAAGKGLKDEDRKVFYAVLELLSTNLQQISREGIPE